MEIYPMTAAGAMLGGKEGPVRELVGNSSEG